MTEKTFAQIGTARNPKGELKVKWANDREAAVKRLVRRGQTEINFVDLPNAMSKLDALKWFKANVQYGEETAEVVDFKIAEKNRALKKANRVRNVSRETNVTRVDAGGGSDNPTLTKDQLESIE